MLELLCQSIQLALRDYQRGRARQAISRFRKSAFALLCSRLGRMALQAAYESDALELTREERRHIATAHLFASIRDSGIEAEDWIVKALVDLAINELEHPAPVSALECSSL